MTKYSLSLEQRTFLKALARQRIKLRRQQRTLQDTKQELEKMITQAKAMNISAYRIAAAAGVSQPKVYQVLHKDRDDES